MRKRVYALDHSLANLGQKILGRSFEVSDENNHRGSRFLHRADFPLDAALRLAGQCHIELVEDAPEGPHRDQETPRPQPPSPALQPQ
jgi:hypothetical protein